MIRIGIVGYGGIGAQHASAFVEGKIEGAKITAVCNRGDSARARAIGDIGEDIAVFADYRELIDSHLADAVIIATPHLSHVEIASYALDSDLHVLLEKPAGASAGNVAKLNKIANEKSELVFAMMFNQRKHPLYAKTKEIIQSGSIGDIRRVNWINTWLYRPQAYYEGGNWRGTWDGEGGGVLLNQASHQLDLLQWLVGMPQSIYCKCRFGEHHDIAVEDDVTAIMSYPNGASGVFVTSTHEWPGTNRLEISGNRGRIVVETTLNKDDDSTPISQIITLDKYEMGEDAFSRETAGDAPWREYDFARTVFDMSHQLNDKTLAKDNRVRIIVDFVDSIANDHQPIARGVDGISSLLMSNAMLLSTWENTDIVLDEFDYRLFDKHLEHMQGVREIEK